MTGIALLPDAPYLGSTLIAHGMALAAAIGLHRAGWAAVMLVSSGFLAAFYIFDVGDHSRWLWLLVGPVLAFALADIRGARWGDLARRIRAPRLRLSLVLALVILSTAAIWWSSSDALMRARVWTHAGQTQLAQGIARAGVSLPESGMLDIPEDGYIDPADLLAAIALIEEQRRTPR